MCPSVMYAKSVPAYAAERAIISAPGALRTCTWQVDQLEVKSKSTKVTESADFIRPPNAVQAAFTLMWFCYTPMFVINPRKSPIPSLPPIYINDGRPMQAMYMRLGPYELLTIRETQHITVYVT